jgi:ankyrin repeat protein
MRFCRRVALHGLLAVIFSTCAVGRPEESTAPEVPEKARVSDQLQLRRYVREGDLEGVRSLVEGGLDPTAALALGARRGSCGVVRVLLEEGARTDGLTAARALVAAKTRQVGECESLLLRAGVSLDNGDRGGETLLIKAARRGSLAGLQQLIGLGADLEVATNLGSTALLEAAGAGCERCVAELLAARATIDCRDRDGWTPLMMASRRGDEAIARLLLESGAKVGLESNLGWRSLTLAVFGGHLEVVRLLIRAGAELDSESPATRSAIRWAESIGYQDVLDLLEGSGASPGGKGAQG